MNQVERAVINALQDGFPVVERPFAEAAESLGLGEEELLGCLETLLDERVLTRFGPIYHAERMGGSLMLAAMRVPAADFDRVAGQVNDFDEVAHNYERDHAFNMWFVLATESAEQMREVLAAIEKETGYRVYAMPRIEEFYVGLRFEV